MVDVKTTLQLSCLWSSNGRSFGRCEAVRLQGVLRAHYYTGFAKLTPTTVESVEQEASTPLMSTEVHVSEPRRTSCQIFLSRTVNLYTRSGSSYVRT